MSLVVSNAKGFSKSKYVSLEKKPSDSQTGF